MYILNVFGFSNDECLDSILYTFSFKNEPKNVNLFIAKYIIENPEKFVLLYDYLKDMGLSYILKQSAEKFADNLEFSEFLDDDNIKVLRFELFKFNDTNSFNF
jgi:hypothetical protein